MRVVLQRVNEASVRVDGQEIAAIGPGLLVLLGIAPGDGPEELRWMAGKVAQLRIFADAEGRMNRSVLEAGGEVLVVSQFTLFGDCRRGRRPGFTGAAAPAQAAPMVDAFVAALRQEGLPRVGQGVFGADLQVALVNDGPVTLILDTDARSSGNPVLAGTPVAS